MSRTSVSRFASRTLMVSALIIGFAAPVSRAQGAGMADDQVLFKLENDWAQAVVKRDAGIIDERLGHAKLAHGAMHADAIAERLFRTAMASFERAEQLRTPGNDDAILRWNTCARTIERLHLQDDSEAQYEPHFGE